MTILFDARRPVKVGRTFGEGLLPDPAVILANIDAMSRRDAALYERIARESEARMARLSRGAASGPAAPTVPHSADKPECFDENEEWTDIDPFGESPREVYEAEWADTDPFETCQSDARMGRLSRGPVEPTPDDQAWWAAESDRLEREQVINRILDRRAAESCATDAVCLGLIPADVAESIMGSSLIGHRG